MSGASPRGAVLLGILFGGLLLGGLRAPLPACAAAAALWALALASPRWSWRTLQPWALFIVWCFVSASESAQPFKAWLFLARWGGFAALLLVLGAQADARLRRLWLYGLWLAGAAAALAALWTGGRSLLATGDGNDLTGFLPPYYNYTAFLEAAPPAAAAAALVRRGPTVVAPGENADKGIRWGLAALAAFLTLMVLAARARGAALALAAAVVLTAVRARAWRALAALAAAGAVALVAATGGSPARLLKREHSASFQRPAIWRAAAAIASERPLFGEGPGNFEQGYLRHRGPADFRGLRYLFSTPYAHSEPLQAAAETGWLGLALLLWALWRSRPRGRQWSAEREAALAAAAAMLAHCLVDNMTQLGALGMLLLSAWTLAGEPEAAPAAPKPFWRAGAAAALLFCLVAWAPQAAADRAQAPAASPAERLRRLQAASGLFPADAGLRGDLARAWLSQTPPRPDRAWPELVRARELDPSNALYPGMQAEFARAKGDWAAEEAFARAALDLEPNYALARMQLAEALGRRGDKGAARAQLEETGRRRGAMDPNGCASGYGAEICRVDESRLTDIERLLARRR